MSIELTGEDQGVPADEELDTAVAQMWKATIPIRMGATMLLALTCLAIGADLAPKTAAFRRPGWSLVADDRPRLRCGVLRESARAPMSPPGHPHVGTLARENP